MQLNFILILLGIAIQTREIQAAQLDPVQTLLNYGKAWLLGNDDDNQPKDDEKDKDGDKDKKKPYMQNETRSLHNDTFYSGYFPVDEWQEIFYILFESRNNETRDTDPLIIWLRGEPGCSTTATIFENNSPLIFGLNETSNQPMLVNNPNSWNNFSNVLYVDQPIGTGFSFIRQDYDGTSTRYYNIDYAVSDFIHFMKGFLDFHTQFRGREMYIIGQDFGGGKYLPNYVKALQDLKKGQYEDKEFDDKFMVNSTKEWAEWIDLKGVAVNGPIMDEPLQRAETVNYAEKMKLVTSVDAFIMKYPLEWCQKFINDDKPWLAMIACSIYDSYATGNPFYPLFNIRNIKEECTGWFDCYTNDPLTQMGLNQPDIVELLGANLTFTGQQNWIWTDCNSWDGIQIKSQYNQSIHFLEDGTTEYLPATIQTKPSEVFSQILNDRELKVLIINGQLDYHTNYFGIEKLVDSFEWYGKEEFNAYNGNELKRWYYTNTTSGETEVPGGDMRTFEKLTYVRVHGTGLYVYKEKPELMTDLLKQWMGDDEGQLRGAF